MNPLFGGVSTLVFPLKLKKSCARHANSLLKRTSTANSTSYIAMIIAPPAALRAAALFGSSNQRRISKETYTVPCYSITIVVS